MFQGESVNTSRIFLLVSLTVVEFVTGLQYQIMVGCNLISLIGKSLRTLCIGG